MLSQSELPNVYRVPRDGRQRTKKLSIESSIACGQSGANTDPLHERSTAGIAFLQSPLFRSLQTTELA